MFGLGCNSLQSIVAEPGAGLDCLISETCSSVDGYTLTPTEAIDDLTQDRPNHVGNLIATCNRIGGSAPTGTFSHAGKFLSMARKWPAITEMRGSNSVGRW